MDRRFAGSVLGAAMCAALVTLGAQSGGPGASSASGTSGASAVGGGAGGRQGAPIRLRAATFTPERGEQPAIRDALVAREVAPGRRAYYIVQFDGPIEDAWKSALAAAGADVLDYIPDFALKVRANPAQARQIASFARVVWVGAFHPAYKLGPEITPDTGRRLYTVRVERGVNVRATESEIVAAGAQVLHSEGSLLTIAADGEQLDAVAHVVDVAVIEPFALRRKHNEFGGGWIMRGDLAIAAGYDGSTQTIAISDTGLGGGSAITAHRDIHPSRIAAIHNWPGAASVCFDTVINDGAVDEDTGHGTHVATSALGAGDSAGLARGTAPASRLVFQAVEDFAMPSLLCQLLLGLQPGYYLAGIPADISGLFQQSYDAGARVHSNSWGSAVNGAYSDDSASADAFIWAHRDLTVTMSAGNSGIDANGDGVVDTGSLNAPATAKNVISVGASEGDRRTNYACDTTLGDGDCAARGGQNDVFTYFDGFGGSFSANPLRDDPSAGNVEQMAAFSSRGPTSDGRIKPDVVAPGTWILSGYSDRHQQHYDASPNPLNGQYQYDGWGDPRSDKYKYMGGTSMSAPLVAGAAAVVRDFYQKAHAHAASAALVKATLVNTAVDLRDENNDGADDNAYPIPNAHEGWGRVDIAAATDSTRMFVDERDALATGSVASFNVPVDASGRPLKVTIAWTDAPSSAAAARHLVNDLDLEVIAPNGAAYLGNAFADGWSAPGGGPDRVNNLENVYVVSPAAGDWIVNVRGFNVPQGPQSFAIVVGRADTPPPSLPRVSVSATTATATEVGTTPGQFTFTRSGDVSTPLLVSYSVSGSATAAQDYSPLSGQLVFNAHVVQLTLDVQPTDDGEVEGDETVMVRVQPGEVYSAGVPSTATVTIISDDQPGDLAISSVVAPSTAAANGAITVTDSTRNQGSFATQSSETGFYLSANSSFGSTDILIGRRVVPLLGPGAMSTESVTLTLPPDVSGLYYIIARADWNASIIETNESNNSRASGIVRVGPDLVVSNVGIPATAAPGAVIAITDVTRNSGPEVAAPSTTGYYLSLNGSWDAADRRLGARAVPSLATSQADTATTQVTVPSDVLAGSYYVVARADDQQVVGEGNESNNTRVSSAIKVGADLIVSAISAPASATPGAPLPIAESTRNQGSGPAGASVTAFYLSINSSVGTGDMRIGERTIGSLAAGASSAATTTVSVPLSTPPGMYYLIAAADADHSVAESSESNNARTATSRVKVGADLTVLSVDPPDVGGAGQLMTVTDTVSNAGTALSSATEAVFFLSVNTSLDSSDVEIGRRPVPALTAGQSHSGSLVLTIPASADTGSYYVIEAIDVENAVGEAVETNNTARSLAVRIGPDISVSALSAPNVTAGTAFTVTETTRNTGGAPVGASVTSYVLSTNTTLDASDISLGSRDVPALSAGEAHAATTTLAVPAQVAAAYYYLFAVADAGAAVIESSETNNTRRVLIRVSAP